MKTRHKDSKNMGRPRIYVNWGEIEWLSENLKVSRPTVRKALYGKTHSLLAMKIRKVALERGGVMEG